MPLDPAEIKEVNDLVADYLKAYFLRREFPGLSEAEVPVSSTTFYGGATANHEVLVSDGTNFNSVAMSGDATIDNTGAVDVAAYKYIQHETVPLAQQDTINFEGNLVEVQNNGSLTEVTISGYDTIEDHGAALTKAGTLNFSGAGVSLIDYGTETEVVIPGGVSSSRAINTTAPLSGGGDLSADRTLTTSMATNKLIGRGTAGTGVMEEITLGTNLSLSGNTLNATGGSSYVGTPDLNNILVADGSDFNSVAMTGDASIDDAGALNVTSFRRHFMLGV